MIMESAFLSAAHTHVRLNHLPLTGLAMAILGLALALKYDSRQTEIVALIIVFMAAAGAWPVTFTGQRAYKAVREITGEDEAAVALGIEEKEVPRHRVRSPRTSAIQDEELMGVDLWALGLYVLDEPGA